MPSVQGLRESRTEEGSPHVVGIHVEWGVVDGQALEVEGPRGSAAGRRFGVVGLRGGGQEREEIAAGKRWRRKVLNSLGVPFFNRSKV